MTGNEFIAIARFQVHIGRLCYRQQLVMGWRKGGEAIDDDAEELNRYAEILLVQGRRKSIVTH
jgi:hypothetical protein